MEMRINLFFIVFFFFLAPFLHAQQKDSVYFVRVIDKDTREGIPFVNVKAELNGVTAAVWTTDLDGMIKIKAQEINGKGNMQITATYPGYQINYFSSTGLKLNDTLVITLKNRVVELEQYVIIDYHQPVLGKDGNVLPAPKSENPVPISKQQLVVFDSLKSGKWKITDSLRTPGAMPSDSFYFYLKKFIHYPKTAIDNNIYGTVYIDFTIDQMGYIQNPVWQNGNVILSFEVVKALSKMPRFDPKRNYFVEDGNYQQTFVPVTYRICVKFELR
jgi:hypothetical protein